jgi:hypothetical protein
VMVFNFLSSLYIVVINSLSDEYLAKISPIMWTVSSLC